MATDQLAVLGEGDVALQDAGTHARAGFGSYVGFVAAAGYWIGACFADTACLILIKATLGQFLPIFGDGTTPAAILGASLLVWAVHVLVLRAPSTPRGHQHSARAPAPARAPGTQHPARERPLLQYFSKELDRPWVL